jgi:hypothetical protein
MYEDSVGPVPSRLYFCTIVIVGSIFLLQLALAIVTDCYGKIIVDEHNNRGTSVMLEVHQKIASLKWFHISVDEQASCELELEKGVA